MADPTGFKKVIAKLKLITDQKTRRVAIAVAKTADFVVSDAKRLVRFKSGNLKNSIHVQDIKITRDSITGIVAATEPYAAAVETGSRPHFPPWQPRSQLSFAAALSISRRGTRAYPYMSPAIENNAGTLKRMVARAVK